MVTLVKGQNMPLAAQQLKISVRMAAPGDLSALLLTPEGTVRSEADFAFYNQPSADGVRWASSGPDGQQLDLDLAAVPPAIDRVLAVVSLDDRKFGQIQPPNARLCDATGTEIASFVISDLTEERAVIAWEVYRRQGTWKVRAVGQGYSGGLAQCVTAHGVQVDDAPAPAPAVVAPPAQAAAPAVEQVWPASVPPATIPEMTIRPPSVPIDAPPVPVPSPFEVNQDERLYDNLWRIFEDAARATAALRSASGYAEQRRDSEMSALLDDPAMRNSPQTEVKRGEAQRRHDELVARATADFKRDVNLLVTELAQLTGALPAPMAAWDSPAWQSWQPAEEPAIAVRIGDLQVEEAPELKVPMVFRLPMRTPLWIDSSDGKRGEATALARTLVVRLLAAHPANGLKVHVADLVGHGAAARALQPLSAGVLHPAATTPGELSEMLGRLTERVDLMQMAAQAGALETLEGKVDKARQLLVLHDFPYGFDDRAVAQLRFLIEEGPAAGVHLLFVADPGDASTLGPLVSSLWRSMLRLSATPDDHIGDPWVGLQWTYTPDGFNGAPALDSVLTRIAGPAF